MKITKRQLRSIISTYLNEASWSGEISGQTRNRGRMSAMGELPGKGEGGIGFTPLDPGQFPKDQKFQDPSSFKPSQFLYDKIKGAEGFRAQVYDDLSGGKIISSYEVAEGTPTIGYGHAIFEKEQNKGTRI